MVQPITDNIVFLTEVKRAVSDLASYRDTEEHLKQEEIRLEKALEAEKKALADTISQTIRKRAEQINFSYDQEISKGQEKLKKVRNKREKAKNQGVKERIAEETAELHDYNRELKIKMKATFQRNSVPHFCNSKWFYSLYFTRGFSEFMVLLLTILSCFLLMPYAVYLLIPVQNPLYLVGIYFVTVVVFGGIYIIINNCTKVRHQDALKEGRSIRNVMCSNDKKIRLITSTIRRDKNESVYDLDKYDDEISRIDQELSEVTHKKKEALNIFDNVTRTILADEITSNSQPRLDQIKLDYDDTVRDAQSVETQIKEKALYIADNFEVYLDKDFLHPEKLDALAAIIRVGGAKNLTDAVASYKSAKTT